MSLRLLAFSGFSLVVSACLCTATAPSGGDGGPTPDGGDSGTTPDSGSREDGGSIADSGPTWDGGSVVDAGACRTACDCPPGLGCFQGQCLSGFLPVYCCSSQTCPPGAQCQNLDGTMAICPGSADAGSCCSQPWTQYRQCCGGVCVNTDNDPSNCGGCGTVCSGATPYCGNGSCHPAPCTAGQTCNPGETCCGSACCTSGQLCCEEEGPVAGGPVCYTPTPQQPTCPAGCSPLCVSDRHMKRDVRPVDEQAILETVARMPISTWSYQWDSPSVRHLGPMAQDFHAAFGLGNTDKAYDPVDAHGVTLAAIKALYQRLEAQQERIDRLERENVRLRKQLAPSPASTPSRSR